jgi:SAM-dependent methyltransferase
MACVVLEIGQEIYRRALVGMKRHQQGELPDLQRLELDWDDSAAIPAEIEPILADADRVLQAYWDQWTKKPIEQYVACDFRDVWRALAKVTASKIARGNTFCEWGCGFGIVTGLASQLGWEAIGIEAESFLVEQAKRFLARNHLKGEILHGNFLPRGSERLARSQSNHASMFHQVENVYEEHDLELDDYALVFAYPWPGEHHFLQEVFRHYAKEGALLLMFLGPYEIELFQK